MKKQKKEYVYYVYLTDQLYIANFPDLDAVCVEDCPASEVFPWIITNLRLSKYATAHLLGEL